MAVNGCGGTPELRHEAFLLCSGYIQFHWASAEILKNPPHFF